VTAEVAGSSPVRVASVRQAPVASPRKRPGPVFSFRHPAWQCASGSSGHTVKQLFTWRFVVDDKLCVELHLVQRSKPPGRPGTLKKNKALWRSWLARRPVTAEVAGSSPVRVAEHKALLRKSLCFSRHTCSVPATRLCSSVGRAFD